MAGPLAVHHVWELAIVGGGVMIWPVGPGPFLLVHLPIFLIGATTGVWLFDIQHQFEDTRWAREPAWTYEAALHGCSHYDFPIVMRWFTANIGVHHVHHLCSRIPSIVCRSRYANTPILRKDRQTYAGSKSFVRTLGPLG